MSRRRRLGKDCSPLYFRSTRLAEDYSTCNRYLPPRRNKKYKTFSNSISLLFVSYDSSAVASALLLNILRNKRKEKQLSNRYPTHMLMSSRSFLKELRGLHREQVRTWWGVCGRVGAGPTVFQMALMRFASLWLKQYINQSWCSTNYHVFRVTLYIRRRCHIRLTSMKVIEMRVKKIIMFARLFECSIYTVLIKVLLSSLPKLDDV